MQPLNAVLLEVFGWHITSFANGNLFDHIEHTGGLPDCVSFITASVYTRITFSFLNNKVCHLMLSN